MQSNPPLIVHVIYRLDYGGLENGLINLINNMPADEFRHAIVCLAGYSGFRHRIRRADVTVYSLEKRPGKDLRVYARLWLLLRRLQPAIVHSRNLGTVDLQWIALAAGVRARLHGEHGWDAADPQGTAGRNLLIRRLCRPSIQRYVTVSRDLAAWLTGRVGISGGRMVQICNGVDLARFNPSGDLPADLPWGRAEDQVVFGTVGRLDPVKNQLALLEAFAALGTNARLIVVGDGPQRQALRNRAAELGVQERVWFTGARDDIPALLRAMDVFVLPSLNEGISNTVLEAMATGIPVAASAVGGNPELVEPATTGLLYSATDPHGLARVMKQYADDPALRRAHGQAARRRAVQKFGLDGMASRYRDLYRTLTSGSVH